MKRLLLVFPLFSALVWAEEHQAQSRTEGEFEFSHDGSYAYMGAGVEFERPKLTVFARGYRLTEGEHASHQVHLGFGRLFSLYKNQVSITPGMAFVAGEEKLRGLAATLDVSAEFGEYSLEASFTQTNPLNKEARRSLWLYPLALERKFTRHWGVAGVLETTWTGNETANEYGMRLVRHDHYGHWYCGYMTAVAEHGRDHRMRFGRVISLEP